MGTASAEHSGSYVSSPDLLGAFMFAFMEASRSIQTNTAYFATAYIFRAKAFVVKQGWPKREVFGVEGIVTISRNGG